MASTFGPQHRNPDYARGEHNYCHIDGEEADLVLARGNATVHSVIVGDAGTTLELKEDGNTILLLDTSAPSVHPLLLNIATSGELTATTVGEGTKLTIIYDGRPGSTKTVLRA